MSTMPITEVPPSDNELLARWTAGEDAAFSELFERYRDGVTRYATRLLGDPDEGHDAAVDAFVRILDGRISGARSFRAVMYTTVHRLCLDRLRRRTRWGRVRRLWSAAPPPRPTPHHTVQGQEDRARLADAIATLPDGHRAAVLLVYEEGLATADASAVLDLTPTQLRSRLAYARRLIRSHLEDS